jgi:hypothetical protein
MEKEMKLSQLQEEQLHDHLVEVMGIGGLVGVVMVFLGWLKYKQRNNPPAMKTRQRPKAKVKAKRR